MVTKAASDSERPLSLVHLFALGMNGIIGVGIFFAPSQVASAAPGSWGLAVYALVLLALLPVALVYAALGSRFRVNGGPYVWASAAFGGRVGFLIGWLTYASAVFSASAVVSGFARHAGGALGVETGSASQAFGVGLVLLLSCVVLTGLKPSARVWTGFTVAKLIPIVVLLVLFVPRMAVPVAAFDTVPEPSMHAPAGVALTRAALVVVFALQGFEVVPVLAHDTRSGARVIPIATVGCLVLVAGLYLLIHWACLVAVPALAASERPLVDAAGALGGAGAAQLLFLGTNVSALGIAFGMFAVTPHYLAALGNEPGFAWLAAEGRRLVPARALVITAALVIVLVLLGDLAQLLVLSSVAVMSQYAVAGLSLLALAKRRQYGLSWRQALPAPFALGAIALLLTGAQSFELLVAGVVVASGAVLYLVRRGVRR
ncbi:MAG TPA: APC family permease [Polyangiaceae bacterium]